MRNLSAIILLSVFGALGVFGQPAQIILLRHGEKPDDKAAVHLSARGEERARALVSLLGRSSPLTNNIPVAALYASKVTRRDHSQRTGETLAPLGKDLGLPVKTPFGSDDYRRLASSVLRDPFYRGKTVVICWTHHDLAPLAAAFGVTPAPRPWKETVFDRLWLITFLHGHAQLNDYQQPLLAGDSTH